MNKTALHTLLSLALIPLAACGQTPVSNHGPASAPAAKAATAASEVGGDLAQSLTAKLEQTYAGQNLKVQSVRSTPIAGLYEVVVTATKWCMSMPKPIICWWAT